jgi:hypothetical protein
MTFLDQIRLKQIDETLNYDKIMRQRAFNIEKLNVNKNNEEDLQEYSQLNEEDIGSANELVNNLIILCTLKRWTTVQPQPDDPDLRPRH